MATAKHEFESELGNATPDSHRDFSRHRGPVTCVAGIPGAQKAVSSGYDSAVGIIDFNNSSVALLGYHRHLVNRVVVNPGGTVAASCSSDYTACLWNIEDGRPLSVLRGHWDDVEDFAFVDDNKGVTVSRDRRILVWDLKSGAIENILEGHHRDVLSVEYADGRLYTSGDDMTLRQWDLASGRMLKVWGPFEVETDTCAIDLIHGRVVLGADDGSLRIFDIDSGKPIRTIEAHRSGIKKVAVSPATGDILSAAYDQRIIVWDAHTFEPGTELSGHPATWERSLNWSPDGTHVLAGTFDGTILRWEAANGNLECEIGSSVDAPGNGCLNDVSCGQSGLCAMVSDDGLVRLARLSHDESEWLGQTIPGPRRVLMNAVCVSRSPSNNSQEAILCGAHDHSLHFLSAEGNSVESQASLALGEGPINCIRTLPHRPENGQGLTAFAACYSGAIVRVGWHAGQSPWIEARLSIHDGAVKSVRIRPGEDIAASGAADGSLNTWSLDGEIRYRLAGHTAIVDDVDFDPSGEFLASVSRDFTVNVYHVDSGRLVHSILLGRESPKCVLFWDRNTVLVGNYWGCIWWVSLDDERVTTHPVAINGISSMARHPEGLVAVSYDGSVSLLNPDGLDVAGRLNCLEQKLPGYECIASFD
jgi:WD40 repeat protein